LAGPRPWRGDYPSSIVLNGVNRGSMFDAGPVQGKTLLVTGGAGAVGHYAVQLSTWAGARVIASTRSGFGRPYDNPEICTCGMAARSRASRG
jgi:hypothetical protein